MNALCKICFSAFAALVCLPVMAQVPLPDHLGDHRIVSQKEVTYLVGNGILSPDGSQIVYRTQVSSGPGSPSLLRITNTDGTHDRPLTADDFPTAFPAGFSPDEKFLLMSGIRWEDMQTAHDLPLWRLQISTGALTLVTSKFGGISANFFPDGKQILLSSEKGIYTIRPDGSGLKKLHGSGYSAQCSPDGKKIAFVTTTPKTSIFHLSIMNRRGKQARRLSIKNITGQWTNLVYFWLDKKALIVSGTLLNNGVQRYLTLVVDTNGTVKQDVTGIGFVTSLAANGSALLTTGASKEFLVTLAPETKSK